MINLAESEAGHGSGATASGGEPLAEDATEKGEEKISQRNTRCEE